MPSSSAVVLTDTINDRIRFVPNTDYVGNASFDFRAWDTTDGNTSGTAGVDTGSGGGTTAFSVDTETASIVGGLKSVTLTSTVAVEVIGPGPKGSGSVSNKFL